MPSRREIDLRLNAAQLPAYSILFDSKGRPNRDVSLFLGWGRGVGKSTFRRQIWWLLVALFDGKLRSEALSPFRGVRIRCLAPTLKQWKLNNWDGILEELTGNGKWAWLGAKLDTQSGQIRFPGGSSVTPFPASAYNARTARGMRTDVLDADEVDDIDASVYDAIAVPWLSEPWSLRMELLCGTPTRGRHGLWWRSFRAGKLGELLRKGGLTDEEALELPDVKSIAEKFGDDADPAELLEALRSSYTLHATYRDVPDTVSARQVAKARANTSKATFEREWESNPDAGEGVVYAEFNEEFHVREAPDGARFGEYIVGMDHGTNDPGVLLLCGIQGHGADAVVWVLEEHYESNVPNHVWNERAAAWPGAKFWPDPSRPDRVMDLRAMGLSVGETDNNILGGVARLSDLLFVRTDEDGERYSRLYVSPKCRNTIREFGLYRRKKHPDGTFDEQPADKDNHAMDALRYAVVGRFGRAPSRKHQSSGR